MHGKGKAPVSTEANPNFTATDAGIAPA